MDNYAASFSLVIISCIMCICIMYIYGKEGKGLNIVHLNFTSMYLCYVHKLKETSIHELQTQKYTNAVAWDKTAVSS